MRRDESAAKSATNPTSVSALLVAVANVVADLPRRPPGHAKSTASPANYNSVSSRSSEQV